MTVERLADVFGSVIAGTRLFWPAMLAGGVLLFAEAAWQRAVGVVALVWVARLCAGFHRKDVEEAAA